MTVCVLLGSPQAKKNIQEYVFLLHPFLETCQQRREHHMMLLNAALGREDDTVRLGFFSNITFFFAFHKAYN